MQKLICMKFIIVHLNCWLHDKTAAALIHYITVLPVHCSDYIAENLVNNGILSEVPPSQQCGWWEDEQGSAFCEFNFDLVSYVNEWLCGM